MDESVPLVVPEINPDDAFKHNGIISNPNCTTVITLMGLYPLHKAFHLKSFIASTYQAVSGSGVAALKELDNQISAEVNNEDMIAEVYPHPIAFNLIPHVDNFDDNGDSKEELKLLNESRKILNNQNLNVNCTCVRVPVRRAHSISVTASFNNPVDLELARKQIQEFPNVDLLDKPQEGIYPMPINSSRNLNCSVGRLRLTSVVKNGLSLWISGDQLWKGAALNAIQIAELIISKESS